MIDEALYPITGNASGIVRYSQTYAHLAPATSLQLYASVNVTNMTHPSPLHNHSHPDNGFDETRENVDSRRDATQAHFLE